MTAATTGASPATQSEQTTGLPAFPTTSTPTSSRSVRHATPSAISRGRTQKTTMWSCDLAPTQTPAVRWAAARNSAFFSASPCCSSCCVESGKTRKEVLSGLIFVFRFSFVSEDWWEIMTKGTSSPHAFFTRGWWLLREKQASGERRKGSKDDDSPWRALAWRRLLLGYLTNKAQ